MSEVAEVRAGQWQEEPETGDETGDGTGEEAWTTGDAAALEGSPRTPGEAVDADAVDADAVDADAVDGGSPASRPEGAAVAPGSDGTPARDGTADQDGAAASDSAGRNGAAGGSAGAETSGAGIVRGRIKVADEVVEKVAALAALEIPGVADLGGDVERALESVRDRIGIGAKRANQGVRAGIRDGEVTVDVTIVIVYGHVVMDVATEVRTNVARLVSRMLGMRVVEVNVTVDDVRMPGRPSGDDEDDDADA
ncbi:Asp23/Gls24 family envelope stress response protein [Microbispora sp. ATCC PTA-5024]|uniref:Asp23/Gls24 family envelope stress response protein n=1 Tax=Microbispora sp. ATCC PTA-5024 TaxID=316330 RepID=UPI0003DDE1B3|nr:Asp23/Gls24 family envelope stress response protein [Microbispora sp. ATCC PTA-5024]ETK30433.1 hypothetical protein MPTA5024_40135 [Microbispora sp. ATCC PTA-5024]